MFAKQTGQDISYEAILAPLDGFAATIDRLCKEGYKGCSVTVPFKFDASKVTNGIGFEVMDAIDSVHEADAVNTLIFQNNKIGGYNTDGLGLVNDIENNLKVPLKGKRILLIGAGGAAAGVLHPLLEASGSPLVIYNRTLKKAESLKKTTAQYKKFRHFSLEAVEFSCLGNEQFDVVINATSAGLSGSEIPFATNYFCSQCTRLRHDVRA